MGDSAREGVVDMDEIEPLLVENLTD